MTLSRRIDTVDVELTISCARNITTRHRITPLVKDLCYFIAVYVGRRRSETQPKAVPKASSPTWDEAFNYNISKDDSLTLELYCYHYIRKTHKIGSSEAVNISSLRQYEDHLIQLYDERGVECGNVCVRSRVLVEKCHSPDRLRDLRIVSAVVNSGQILRIPPGCEELLSPLNTLLQLVKAISQLDYGSYCRRSSDICI